MTIQNETVQNLFGDLGIDSGHSSAALRLLAATDSRTLKDLKLNIAAVTGGQNLSKKEAWLLALSIALNEKQDVLIAAFEKLARSEHATDTEIAETVACVSVMNANNVLYRFRYYMDGIDYYNNTPAGMRMSVMMNPVLGKEFFELMSLVISAVNGCQQCVTAHEHSVKQHGASEARIYDAIRLASVISSFCAVL